VEVSYSVAHGQWGRLKKESLLVSTIKETRINLIFTFDVKITDDETNASQAKDANDVFYRDINRRLLLAILEKPEQLQRVLTSKCALHLPEEPEYLFFDVGKHEVEYDRMLAPSIALLSEEDQVLWHEWVEVDRKADKGEFITLVDDIYESIHIECVECSSQVIEKETPLSMASV